MDPEAAAQMIARDRARGLRPFLLVASAGTTSTGAVDPIAELVQLARSEGLWNQLYLSSTRIDGLQLLRLCVISHRTHRPDVEDAMRIIRAAVASSVPTA